MGLFEKIISFCFILLNLAGHFCDENARPRGSLSGNDREEFNEYLQNLQYNPDEVLAFKEGGVTSFKKKEGSINSKNTFIVITRELRSISNGKADVGVISSNEHRTFPGSMLVANYRLIDNTPDIVSIDRAPIKYTVNLPGLTNNEGSFRIVPTFANYQSSINNVLKTWFDKYSDTYDVNAIFRYEQDFAYSKEQLKVKFGSAFSYSQVEAGIDFESINKQEKLIMIHKYEQVFYTASVESPHEPADLFGEEAKLRELKKKINDKNPPVLVDSTSYGRQIYVKLETSSTSNEAKTVLSTKLTYFHVGVENENEYTRQLENLNMQVYVIGGSNEHVQLIQASTIKEINEIIIKHSKFQKNNPGYPLSYSSEFVKDNNRARVTGTAQYVETTRTEHEKGTIQLKHTGWYVAQFRVQWYETEIDEEGSERVIRRRWNKNMNKLTAPFNTEIELAGNCDNISAYAREATGLIWEPWRVVFDKSGIPLVKLSQFSIWGTTLSPKYSIEPSV